MRQQKSIDHILKHSTKESKIHEAMPKKLRYEEDEAPDMKGESIAFRRELEEVNFKRLQEKEEIEEVIVSVEPGDYVAWKIVRSDEEIESTMVPWKMVLKLEFDYPTWGGDE